MYKRLLACVREYKKPTFITFALMVLEVGIEVAIPFITANLVNSIKANAPIEEVVTTGLILVAMALVSLTCGGLGGFTCSKAAAGFAKNVRGDMFHKIQTYSFENIDKFSSSSLVTRMTTDIQHV